MVKLVYHTSAVGPIGLDYTQPVITVGSDPDNDLVLPHPSVRSRHCRIEFLEESVRLLPPLDGAVSDPATVSVEERQYSIGERLEVGEVVFEVQHSGKTVAIPCFQAMPEPEFTGFGTFCYCEHCRRSYPASALTRLGLAGQPNHLLCPKCSRELAPPASSVEGPEPCTD